MKFMTATKSTDGFGGVLHGVSNRNRIRRRLLRKSASRHGLAGHSQRAHDAHV